MPRQVGTCHIEILIKSKLLQYDKWLDSLELSDSGDWTVLKYTISWIYNLIHALINSAGNISDYKQNHFTGLQMNLAVKFPNDFTLQAIADKFCVLDLTILSNHHYILLGQFLCLTTCT